MPLDQLRNRPASRPDRLSELSAILERLEQTSRAQLTELQTLRAMIGPPEIRQPLTAIAEPLAETILSPPVLAKPAKKRSKIAPRFISLALLLLIGYFGYHYAFAKQAPVENNAQPATATAQTVHRPDYKESQADVPFDKTEWDTLTDTDFGISLTYPKNASNIERVIGGSNIWLLRKQGYLMKFSMVDLAGQTPADWWDGVKEGYSDKDVSVGKFKNLPAHIIKTPVPNATSGTTYAVERNGFITEIWIKDESPTTDDGQRLAKMTASLQVTQ